MILAGALLSALIAVAVSAASAQPVAGRPSATAATPQTARIDGIPGNPRVTVDRGVVGCRTLLSEIARLSRMEVRNLARVPDERVYVEFSGEPLGSAVGKLLAYAKVDYVLRGGSTSEPPLLIVAEAGKSPVSSPAAERGAAPPMMPPSAAVTEVTAEGPPVIELQEKIEEVPLGPAPAWQPVDVTPQEVELPPDMVPNGFPVTAPPPVPAKATNPAPVPQSPKH